MRFQRMRGEQSVIVPIKIMDSSSVLGAFLTTLTYQSVNLVIAWKREFDATWTTYKQADGNIEDIATIGTFVNPSTSSKIRFKHSARGSYEIQFHNSSAAFSANDLSKYIEIEVYEETTSALNIGPNPTLIPLVPYNPQDGVRMGLTALPNAIPAANGGLPTTDGTKINQTTVLDTTQSNYAPAKAGDKMDLKDAPNNTALIALAAVVEAAIISEVDGEQVLKAITDKIASVNPTLGELSLAAIASAVATALLVTPANKINSDSSNAVKIQKMGVTLDADDVTGNLPAQVKAEDNIDFGALKKASIKTAAQDGLATKDDIQSGLSTFDPATDTVARVTLTDTVTNLTNAPDVSGLATSAGLTAAKEEIESKFPNVQVLTDAGWKKISG
ncbi:MAG: hypothetical protein LLG40_13285 [Deltaproteobacteria bacterium]|nr:hypothetical protein [Deltaproteobacteria bacterium]